jgi:phosphoribosylformimino-5-aminoimidazole carboxamide ribotide isomerase
MDLVPVIDLLHGQVVRARQGDRQSYRPIVSPLCGSSEPLAVARVLCAHCDARQLYVADLDALQGGAAQVGVLKSLLESLPGVALWLDAGFADIDQAHTVLQAIGPLSARIVPVFGSESLRSRAALEACFAPGAPPAILSLDRRDGRRLDAAGAWDLPALWPPQVIVMTLERVGAGTGPDLDTLHDVAARSPDTRLIGAGGIANEDDLLRARDAGASAWLVASALHDLSLPPARR